MNRSTLATIVLAPVWIQLAFIGVASAVLTWPFRGVAVSMAWALDKLGDWVMSLDEPKEGKR